MFEMTDITFVVHARQNHLTLL